MEPFRKELTLDESIKQVMQTLPPPIRTYLAQGKYTAVAKSLMTKYGLHIDQATVLEREIMLLLMGIENPDEFVQTLATDANLNQQTVSSIVQDVNVQIFMPLRQEMMLEIKKAPTPPAPPKPAAPRPVAMTPRVGPPPAKPAAGESHFHLQNKLPPPAVVQPPRPPVPLQPPSPPKPKPPVMQAPPSRFAPLPPKLGAPVRESQTFTESHKLLADHEEPHIDIKDKVQVVSKPVAEPPPNLPGALPPQPIPAPPPPPPPVPPSPQKPPKSYSVDPYREPIDEK